MIKHLLTIAITCLLATGCIHPSTPKPSPAPQSAVAPPAGADGSLLFQADTIIKNGAGLVSQFLSFAYQNQAMLSQWPQIGATANTLQAKAPDYIEEVIAARKIYHDDPTPQNRTKLETAVGTFTAAYEQGRNFQVQSQQYFAAHPPLPPPAAATIPIPNAPSPPPASVPIPTATPGMATTAPAASTNVPATTTNAVPKAAAK